MWFHTISDPRYRQIAHAYWKVRHSKGVYATIRMALCPLMDIERFLPEKGTIMDVGCGAGLLLQWLSLGQNSRNLRLVGIEIDQRRIDLGREVCKKLGIDNKIDLRVENFTSTKDEQDLSALTFIDVLHHIDFDMQRLMLRLAFEKLAQGGIILIKEVDTKPAWKYIYNYIFDTLTHLTNITKGKAGYYRSLPEWKKLLIEHGFSTRSVEVKHADFAPHIILIGEKNGK